MRSHSESKSQQALIRWWDHAHKSLGVSDARLLFAIPNGGARTAITGSILKSEGVRKGIPDLFLAVPKVRGDMTFGLFIEMKTNKGRASLHQIEMLVALKTQGYECEICRSWEEAKTKIEKYLTKK